MNLQLTKKLSDKLKVDLVKIDTTKYNDIENYHCNLLKFGRDNCVLITNDKNLFSFFIYGLKASDFKNFEESISQRIFKILIELGFSQPQFEQILDSLQNIQYSKTSNRSVISSMNDMKNQIESYIYHGDNIYEINRKLNQTPYKYIEHKYATDLYKELLNINSTEVENVKIEYNQMLLNTFTLEELSLLYENRTMCSVDKYQKINVMVVSFPNIMVEISTDCEVKDIAVIDLLDDCGHNYPNPLSKEKLFKIIS